MSVTLPVCFLHRGDLLVPGLRLPSFAFVCSDIVTEGFYIARTGLGPFGEGWETKGEDVDWFLYNRMWGVGVFALIEGIGLEPNDEVSCRCRSCSRARKCGSSGFDAIRADSRES